ncbi:hypothetical protein G6F61_003298 [Rhizopus arrhizus]|nr:hypothetical protein G6F61_003298 [Rhizopus arrhizus]
MSDQRTERIVNGYRLQNVIGRGSSGKVMLGCHEVTGDLAVVKIVQRIQINRQHRTIDGMTCGQSEFDSRCQENVCREQRTIREGYLMRLLNHPNIIHVKDMLATDDSFYLLMEYAPGGTLGNHLARHRCLGETETRYFARQIVSAMDYMHRNSIVHRDLKIDNIMLAEDHRQIKIADFGLSNLYRPDRLLQTHCGSMYFAAPEMLNTVPYCGPEVDVWSLGVILFVLITGDMPFNDATAHGLYRKIHLARVQYPSEMSASCCDLLSRIFQPDRARRILLADVMRHPWMHKHYRDPIPNYLPLRLPLTGPLSPSTILMMVKGFDLGSEREIKTELEAVIRSPTYRYCANYVALIQARKASGMTEPLVRLSDPTLQHWNGYDDPQTVPAAYHPLCSLYYLISEKVHHPRAVLVADSPASLHPSSLCPSPADSDGSLGRMDARIPRTPFGVPDLTGSQLASVSSSTDSTTSSVKTPANHEPPLHSGPRPTRRQHYVNLTTPPSSSSSSLPPRGDSTSTLSSDVSLPSSSTLSPNLFESKTTHPSAGPFQSFLHSFFDVLSNLSCSHK